MVNDSLEWKVVTKTCKSIPNVNSSLCTGTIALGLLDFLFLPVLLTGQTTGWEWNAGFTGFNLNTDMAIYKVDALKFITCTYLFYFFFSTFLLTVKVNHPVNIKTALCLPLLGKVIIYFHQITTHMLFRYAISFGRSNDIWLQEFSNVYFKMLKNGYERLINVR